MTTLDITTSRDYFKIRLNQIYLDILFYLQHPFDHKQSKLLTADELDSKIEQINKTMFKSYKAKDHMKAIRLTNITKKQLFLYIKLRNKNQLKDKIGPFQLEFKLFQPAHLRPNRFHSELSNKVSPTIGKPKTASITKTSSSIFARRRVSQVTSKLQHKTTLKKSVTKIQTSNAFTGYKHDGTPSSNSANNSPRSSPEKSFNGSVKESILQDLPSPMSHAIEMNLPRSFVQESPSTSSLHEPLHAIEMITKPDSSIALNMISSCNVISDLRPPQWSDVDLYELPLLIAVGDKTDELQLQITVCSELFKDLPNLELFQTSLASNPTGEPTKGTLRSKSSHEELTKKHQLQSTIQLADLHQDRVLWICLNQNKKSTDSSPKSSTTSSLAGNSIRSVNLERVHSGISSSGVVNTVNVPAGPGPISSKPLFATLRNFFGNVLHLRNTLNSTNATRSVSGTLRDIKFKPPSMMTMSAGVPDQSFSLQLELQLGCRMEHDPRRRLELMYNQVDLYVVLALEGKLELESMRSLITHCARWQRLFSPVSLQVLHTARLHQSLSSHEDALCRTLAVSRLLARHARVRIHSYLAQALGDLLARSWRYSASVNWPRALQRELDEQLLEVLELLFRADMPAALLTLQRHNYSRLGRYLFAGQVALVIRVVALRRWLAIDHINLSLRNTISSTNTSTTLNSSNANTTITSNNNMSSLPADGSTTNISDAKLTITASKSNPDAGPDLTESLEHGSVLGDALLQSKSGISSDPSPPEVTVSPAISNVIDPPIEEKPPMLANLKTPTELQQHLQLCLQAPVSSNELPFVASLAKGFERAAKLWLRYMESQKPPSNVEELVHFSRALEQFCVGLVRIFRPPNKQGEVSDQPHHYHHYRTSSTKKGKKSHKNKRLLNEITKTAANHLQKWSSVHLRSSKSPSKSLMPETDQSMTGSCQSINNTTSSVIGSLPSSPIRTSAPASIGTLPKESEFCKTKKKKSDTLQQRWEGTWAQFESIEHRQMHLNAMFKAPLPKAIQQTLRSIHVLIDYHLCNWIPFPLKMEIERLLLPLDYSEATEQAKRNAIFQATPYKDVYNSLRVAISYLNELHDEPIPLRISLSTIQGWFPLSVTQAWVAQETLKIKQECAVWSDYLKDFVSTSDSRYAHFNKRSTESVRMLGAHSQKSMVVLSTSSQAGKRPSLSAFCADGKQLHLEHLVELAECMYENLIAFVSWPDAVFPARTARDIVYGIDLVAVVLKTWYQKQEPGRRRRFEQQFRDALESFVEHIRSANDRLNANPFVDPEYRVNVSKWMRHQEGCWCGVLLSLHFEQIVRRQTETDKKVKK